MTPGEELADRIRQFVATQVGPESVRVVTEATCRAVSTLMQDPSFTDQLLVVAQLRQENQWLKSQVIQLQRTLGLMATGSASSTVSRPRKKAAAKKTTATRIQGNAPRNAKAAFVKGVRQAKR